MLSWCEVEKMMPAGVSMHTCVTFVGNKTKQTKNKIKQNKTKQNKTKQ
jgi:hypothetical protein